MRARAIEGAHGKSRELRGRVRFQWYELGDERPPLPPTARQREILHLASHGWGNKHIAAALGISVHTVNAHWRMIFERLDLTYRHSPCCARPKAVAIALRRGYIR